MNVLLAEDDPINQKVASALLKKAGHSVRVAQNGLEATALITRERFDIVLMDMHMPEMDGLAATRAIRALTSPAAAVPIVALTASGSLSDIQVCLDAGMNYFLVKPFKMDRFDSILAEIAGAANKNGNP